MATIKENLDTIAETKSILKDFLDKTELFDDDPDYTKSLKNINGVLSANVNDMVFASEFLRTVGFNANVDYYHIYNLPINVPIAFEAMDGVKMPSKGVKIYTDHLSANDIGYSLSTALGYSYEFETWFPTLTSCDAGAMSNVGIEVYLPLVDSIFGGFSWDVVHIHAPSATTIKSNAVDFVMDFSIDAPIKTIESSAFNGTGFSTGISLSGVTRIPNNCFNNCSEGSVSLPNVTAIGTNAIYNSITSFSMNALSAVGASGFVKLYGGDINLPSVKQIANTSFVNISYTQLYLNSLLAQNTPNSAFSTCESVYIYVNSMTKQEVVSKNYFGCTDVYSTFDCSDGQISPGEQE